VKAIFRRVERLAQERDAADPGPLEFEGLIIDQHKRQVTVRRQAVHLTTREFDLLVRFARSPGRVYTRAQLLDLVWGYGAGSYEHTVNSHINRLRAKIESDPSRPRFIQTVWGIGYRFYDPAFDDSRPRADQAQQGGIADRRARHRSRNLGRRAPEDLRPVLPSV
jgi:two-component system OmpR family response regulator